MAAAMEQEATEEAVWVAVGMVVVAMAWEAWAGVDEVEAERAMVARARGGSEGGERAAVAVAVEEMAVVALEAAGREVVETASEGLAMAVVEMAVAWGAAVAPGACQQAARVGSSVAAGMEEEETVMVAQVVVE